MDALTAPYRVGIDRSPPGCHRDRLRRTVRAWSLGVLLCALFIEPAAAQNTSREYEIKAAYLHKFLIFTDWPPAVFGADDAPFTVCIVGADPFGPILDSTLARETAHGRTIAVRRIAADGAEAQRCHLAFLGTRDDAVRSFLNAVGDAPLLTVSEAPAFARVGGMIELFTHRNRIRFEVNPTAVDRTGLRLDANLLRLSARR